MNHRREQTKDRKDETISGTSKNVWYVTSSWLVIDLYTVSTYLANRKVSASPKSDFQIAQNSKLNSHSEVYKNIYENQQKNSQPLRDQQ